LSSANPKIGGRRIKLAARAELPTLPPPSSATERYRHRLKLPHADLFTWADRER
jgi:hypothetical protein